MLLPSSTAATEQIAGVAELNVVGNPELAVAVRIIDVKVIDCSAFEMTMGADAELPE